MLILLISDEEEAPMAGGLENFNHVTLNTSISFNWNSETENRLPCHGCRCPVKQSRSVTRRFSENPPEASELRPNCAPHPKIWAFLVKKLPHFKYSALPAHRSTKIFTHPAPKSAKNRPGGRNFASSGHTVSQTHVQSRSSNNKLRGLGTIIRLRDSIMTCYAMKVFRYLKNLMR